MSAACADQRAARQQAADAEARRVVLEVRARVRIEPGCLAPAHRRGAAAGRRWQAAPAPASIAGRRDAHGARWRRGLPAVSMASVVDAELGQRCAERAACGATTGSAAMTTTRSRVGMPSTGCGRTPPGRRSRRGCASARRASRRRIAPCRDRRRRTGSGRRRGRRRRMSRDRRIGAGDRLLLGCDRPGRSPARSCSRRRPRPASSARRRSRCSSPCRTGTARGREVERDLGGGDLRQPPAVAVDQRDERHAAHCDGVRRLDRAVDVARHRDRDHPVAVAQRSRRKQEIEGADGPPVEAGGAAPVRAPPAPRTGRRRSP